MKKASIYHESTDNLSYPLSNNTIRVRLIAAKNDLDDIKIIYGPKFDSFKDPVHVKNMEFVGQDQTHDYYNVKISLEDPRFRYHFLLKDYNGNKYWFNEKGFFKSRPRGHEAGFFQYPIITEHEKFDRPSWLKEAIFYEIFPDRFYNGNPDNNPKDILNWQDSPGHYSNFGGDLEGIIKKLDYLKNLGINAIYLTPIFKSDSNHKYNTEDYYKIDPHFGNLDTAKKLVNKAHQKNIKVILDAVFNHCDINFFAFQDLIKNGKDSKYKDWFFYEELPIKTENPINYATFATQVKSMPKLNTNNPKVQEYLLNVVEYWMNEINIDGWRLDVADEVHMNFWLKFRKKVKEINKDAVIIGEIWHSARKWLRGDRFDTVMNYPFNWAVMKFFGTNEISVNKFSSLITKNYYHYREDTSQVLLNLLSSHDIPRIYEYCESKKQLKLTIIFMLTFPGVPMLYYGDELGLKGGKDPDNRRCMPWDRINNNEILEYYKKIIGIRKKITPLNKGDFKIILKDEANNVFGFQRQFNNKFAYVVFNNSHIPKNIKFNVNFSGKYTDLIDNHELKSENNTLSVKLNQYEGKIFIRQ